jgi:PAS domain S-box-containing protein
MAPTEDPAHRIDDATEVLTRRLRLALVLCLVPILLFALADLRLSREHLGAVWGLKVVALVVVGAALAALQRPRERPSVIAIALATAVALYALSSLSAFIARDPLTTPLLTVSIAVSTATLLPWGVRAQWALVAIAAIATVATVAVGTGGFAAVVSYPNVGVAIGLLASIYIAFELQRSRGEVASRAFEQQRAEMQVRRLNAELEQRVADRTAELERVNGELATEVAERRRAQAEQTALIENVGHAVWAVDRSYRLIAFNSLMAELHERYFGVPLAIGATFEERVPTEARDVWRLLYDRALGGERFSVEQYLEMPEGARCYSTSFHPIVADGEVTGFTAVSADVTERKRAEEAERRHQAELTHVLRLATMGEMAAGLAHEINQPLAAIVNYARGCAIRLQAGGVDGNEIAEAVDRIGDEALRAGDIIRRLRRLVRKEAPRQESFDLSSVVEDVIELFAPESRELAIAVDVRLAAGLPEIFADPIQIKQVVLNLVRNGIEAMAESDAPRRLTVATERSASGVELVVEDSGPGLNSTQSERVFDAFFTTKSHGLGMGLSISRTIAQSHRGKLIAEPCATGARFRLTLPAAAPPEAAESPPESGGMPASGRGELGLEEPRRLLRDVVDRDREADPVARAELHGRE